MLCGCLAVFSSLFKRFKFNCSLSKCDLFQQIGLTWAQMMNEKERAKRKIVETMTSTERCGPRLCNEQVGQWCTVTNNGHENHPVVKQCRVIKRTDEYKPWEKSVVTTTSWCSGLSSAWNEGSQISWPCEQKWGGWSTWQTRVSVGGKQR